MPSESRLERIRERAQVALDEDETFESRVLLDFGEEGAVFVDGPAREVRAEAAPADCHVRVSLDDFIRLARGELSPTRAFFSGALKIDGDLGLALELAQRMRSSKD